MENGTEVTLDRPLPALADHTGAKSHPAGLVTRPADPDRLIRRALNCGNAT
ncbi:hypothetical protein GCM10009745_16360 [Kribbella yunnanensis]|uniref:Uncharacterized protein n=1 Tax=Kribbella yunnanensis TaxID=190194 RepID=A0ABN2GNE2_9ACTN